MDQDELARRLIRSLSELCPELAITQTGEDELYLKLPQGGSSHLYLSNLAARLDGTADAATIAQFARSAVEALRAQGAEAPLSDLVPLVRDLESYVRAVSGRFDQSVDEVRAGIAHLPLAGPLHVVFGFDGAETMRTASAAEVAKFGMTPEALLARATANLRGKLTEIEQHGDVSHLCMFTAGGNYESSLLLDRSVWESALEQVQGTLLAFVPARDIFVLVDSENTLAVSQALRLSQQVFETGSYPIWPGVLAWNGERWEPYRGELPEPAVTPSEQPPGAVAGDSDAESPPRELPTGPLPLGSSVLQSSMYALMIFGAAWQGAVWTLLHPGVGKFGTALALAPPAFAWFARSGEARGARLTLRLLAVSVYLIAFAVAASLVALGRVPAEGWSPTRLLGVLGAVAALLELRRLVRVRRAGGR